MKFVKFNPNPCGRSTGDCTVRAIAVALDIGWKEAYRILASFGYSLCDMPSSNMVWGEALRHYGFRYVPFEPRSIDLDMISDFYRDYICVIGFNSHVATMRFGTLFDAWDSTHEVPEFMWIKKEE